MINISRANRIILFFLTVLLVLSIASTVLALSEGKRRGVVRIHFLDVGQGDSIFIETGLGTQILIDGGPDGNVLRELGKVMPFYDRSIDMVLLTHPDADHVSGLIDVLNRYRVQTIVETGVACHTSQCDAWFDAVDSENANIIFAHKGYRFDIDERTNIEIINPFTPLRGGEVGEVNNSSIVLRLNYDSQSVLLTGDIEAQIEKKLPFLANIDVDFLKLAHHGSKTSTIQEFLDATSPDAAFISSGINNRYGHPHEDVIRRLEENAIVYYNTASDGRIELVLDGLNYKIITAKK